MRLNLDRLGGLIHSQRVLLALTEAGVPREEAYRLVQRNAMKVWDGRRRFPRGAARRQGRDQGAIARTEIRAQFDLGYHLKHVDTIFKRVFGA